MDIVPIPDDVLIPAINEVCRQYKVCSDSFGEFESAVVRQICGDKYQHIETDWIRKRADNLRKRAKLDSVNGGPKRKKWVEPTGRYAEYLKSDHWRRFRLEVLEFWEMKCCLCYEKATEVHHRTYTRIENERISDCVAMCSRCHKRVHGVMVDGNEVFSDKKEGLF